jgi:hypothetical protein
MAYFESAEQLYEYLGKAFQDTVSDEELYARMRRTDMVVQYRLRAPESQVTVAMLPDAPGQVDLGPTHLKPTVVVRMDADTAHRFFLGKVNVTLALSRRQMNIDGPVDKILQLIPILQPMYERYETLLNGAGREDLVAAAVSA